MDKTKNNVRERSGRTDIFGLCVHHTDNHSAELTREVLKKRGLRTHFIVDADGVVSVEHPLEENAAACVGFNKWFLQLDVVGRLENSPPTRKQVESLKKLIRVLANGRPIDRIDANFAEACRKSDNAEVQKLTRKYYGKRLKFYRDHIDELPFVVIYHGEVRPTKCCGKYLISIFDKILEDARHTKESNGDG